MMPAAQDFLQRPFGRMLPDMNERDPIRCGFSDEEWAAALPWAEYFATVEDKRDIWESNARRALVDEYAEARLSNLPGPRRILVLTEDWCGDAARTVPAIAKALDAAPLVEHRYLNSDTHPETIDRYLTHGGRAIPMVVAQDGEGNALGIWGPRPAALQALMRAQQRDLGPPAKGDPDAMGKWYAPIMAWYARDKGRTTIEELLMLLERGGRARD